MMKIKRVNIIGSGNLAGALYKELSGKIEVLSVYSRSRQQKGAFASANIVDSLANISTEADLNIICVSDDAISTVAKKLPVDCPVVHTSGAVSVDVLSRFKQFGVLYPLQTFSGKRQIQFESIPFFLESNSAGFFKELKNFCSSYLTRKVYSINSDDRLKIHLAAVFANNFTTYLMEVATGFLRENQLPEEVLKPLVMETIAKFELLGYKEAQTGPARRGDKKTMQRHLELIDNKTDKEIYRLISKAIHEKFRP